MGLWGEGGNEGGCGNSGSSWSPLRGCDKGARNFLVDQMFYAHFLTKFQGSRSSIPVLQTRKQRLLQDDDELPRVAQPGNVS